MQSIFHKEKKRDVRIKQKREKMESRKRKRIEKKMEGTKKRSDDSWRSERLVCLYCNICPSVSLYLNVWSLLKSKGIPLLWEFWIWSDGDFTGFIDINDFRSLVWICRPIGSIRLSCCKHCDRNSLLFFLELIKVLINSTSNND